MSKTVSITGVPGSETKTSRLADEVAKRRWLGQHNPAGARTSGLRWRCHNLAIRTQRRRQLRGEATPKDGANAAGGRMNGRIGLNPDAFAEGPYPNSQELMLEAGPRENPMSGILGGPGNVTYGGTMTPPCNRKGRAGKPPPTGARASALPDLLMLADFGSSARHPTASCGAERSHPPPLDAAVVTKSHPAAADCYENPILAVYRQPSIALNQWLTIAMPDLHPNASPALLAERSQECCSHG